jgi:predicted component of type VI protein secretion system
MQAVLVMFRNDGEPRSFSVTRDITVIGRREDCDLRIPLGDVSRKHCRLIRDGETFRVEDLGSSNGTFRNGERVQEATLVAGDSVQLGPVVFVLQIDGVPADDKLQPLIAPPAVEQAPAAAVAPPAEEGVIPVIDEEGTMGPSTGGGVPTEEELDSIDAGPSLDDEDDDDGFNAVLDELSNHQKTPRK